MAVVWSNALLCYWKFNSSDLTNRVSFDVVCTVEVEVILLDTFAMIAFAVGQPEQAFLKDRIFAIPQGQRETEALLVVGDAGQTIFSPALGARARLVMGEVIPGVAALAVVLAHGPPLTLA